MASDPAALCSKPVRGRSAGLGAAYLLERFRAEMKSKPDLERTAFFLVVRKIVEEELEAYRQEHESGSAL